MTIRAVVFDIGGILEIIPGGGDPTIRFPDMIARWETRLGLPAGSLGQQIAELSAQFERAGQDGGIGTLSEAAYFAELLAVTGWDQPQLDAFRRDFWDTYCGNPNPDLVVYLGSLRPRYHTALLSNSFDGARREEEARLHLSQIADLIIYSHEVGVAKPDPRIYALTCERLGCRPEEIVFLDDAERNVAAAAAYGIHTILFRDNTQAIDAIQALLAQHSP